MRLYFSYFLYLITTLVFVGCGNYTNKKNETTTDNSNKTIEKITSDLDYASIKSSIFTPHCIRCHFQYENYSSVKEDLSKIRSSVLSDRMPRNASPLSSDLKQILIQWIDSGALESANMDLLPKPQPQDENLLVASWASVSKNILVPKCLVCHNPSGEANFLDLSTRQAIFSNRNRTFSGVKLLNFDDPDQSYFIQVILDPLEPMPPINRVNISRLNEQEVSTLKEWFRLGMP